MYGTPNTTAAQQVVNCRLYCDGRAVRDIDIEHLDEVPDAPGQLIWIGLYDPDEEVLAKVQKRFGLHELAIEDAHLAHQRAAQCAGSWLARAVARLAPEVRRVRPTR